MAQAQRQVWPRPAETKAPPKESKTRRFLTGSLTIMENGRLTIPYPILALIASLFVVIAGQTLMGVWWASSMTEKMQNLKDLQGVREQQHLEHMKRLESTIDEQRIWITTTRERLVKLEQENGRRQ